MGSGASEPLTVLGQHKIFLPFLVVLPVPLRLIGIRRETSGCQDHEKIVRENKAGSRKRIIR